MAGARQGAKRVLSGVGSLPLKGPTNIALLFRRQDLTVDPFRLDATQSLAAEFRKAAIAFGNRMQTGVLVGYDEGRNPDEHEIATLGTDEVPGLADLVTKLEAPAEIAIATAGVIDERWPLAFVVSLGVGSPRIWYHFFRRMTAASRVKRSGRIAVLVRDRTFDQLEVDPILFDPLFDAVESQEELLLTKQRNFESVFAFVQRAAAAARATLTQATVGLQISNFNDFLNAASADSNMVAKVRGIERKLAAQPNYAQRMTMANIRTLKANHPDLPFTLEGPKGKEQLTYRNDPQHRWEILKLLDDDYVQSLLTDIMYEANSKTPI